jgi:multidrug efflux pump subunit AcrA (membrane-fusion protein)
MISRRWISASLIAALVAVGALAALLIRLSATSQPPTTFARSAQVVRETVQATITAQGSLEAAESKTLTFAVPGEVLSVDVEVGAEVGAGQHLASIRADQADDAVTQATRTVTQAERAIVQADLRIQSAAQAEVAASDAVRAAVRTRNAAQATLDQAREALKEAKRVTTRTDPTPMAAPNPTPAGSAVEEASQAIEAAKVELSQARAGVSAAQAQRANASGEAQAADLAKLEAQDKLAEAHQALTDAQSEAAKLSLIAPFDGVVTQVGIAQGDRVGGAATVSSAASPAGVSARDLAAAEAANPAPGITVLRATALEVAGAFAEADAAALRVGQRATVTFPALEGASASGSVTWISPTPSAVSGVVTYRATIALSEAPSAIRLGQTATIQVVTAEAVDALSVPANAVTVTGPSVGTVERITDPDRQATQTVTIGFGLEGDTRVEITSGLAEGDLVLVSIDSLDGLTPDELLNQLGGMLQPGSAGRPSGRTTPATGSSPP